jgi:AraC-like DNA-binding protein
MDLARSHPCNSATYVTAHVQHGDLRVAWSVRPEGVHGAPATIDQQPAGPILFASFNATPATGHVCAQDHGGRGFRALLFQLSGRQRIVDRRGEQILAPGDVLLWGSQDSGSFEVPEMLEELQILVPNALFERQWPVLASDGGRRHLGAGAMVTLARAGLQALWQQRQCLSEDDLHSALIAVIDLIGKAGPPKALFTRKARLFDDILRFIDLQLEDPGVSPVSIAHQYGCSVRTLHALFAERRETVAGLIRRRRLERCRERLGDVGSEERIGDLAMQWGFADAAHFSKLFKATYGLSPRQYRQRNGAGA